MEKEFHTTEIRDDTRIDFRWVMEGEKIKHFAINVSLLEDDKRTDVYRVDTAHGYLHEQRFWLSPKPKSLEEEYKGNLNAAFIGKKDEVMKSFERWVELFRKSRGRL